MFSVCNNRFIWRRSGKFILSFLPLLFLSFVLSAQNAPRKIMRFDHGWELYRIRKPNDAPGRVKAGRGTSWKSQFNDEHIRNRDESADSVVSDEVSRAVDEFKMEYPGISHLKWDHVSLPAAARIEAEVNPGKDQFVGIAYYRKRFRIPASFSGKRLSILFDGAMQAASVWVNGKFILQHQGGYLPFSVPLNDFIKQNRENEIIVRVDNRDNPNTPPGKPLAKLGFLYWSGIYRDAWLVATNPVHITDAVNANTVAGGGVFVRYENVSPRSATVLITTQVKNDRPDVENGLQIKQVLADNRGNRVATVTSDAFGIDAGSKKEQAQRIILHDPELWSPDTPNLYQLITEVWQRGKLSDRMSEHIGIRWLSYTRKEGFKINGKPLRIVGTNRHQACPFVGNALTGSAQYRDLKRIKEAGFNFVRLAHYPQDPAVFDICDSLGLMVADPIPGWQFFNNNGIFKDRVFRDIRQMIRRDRNHPCITMWEVSLNESYPPDSFRTRSAAVAHEEYPGDQCFTSGDTYGSERTAWDVPYNGWEDPFGRPQNVQPEQPGFVREYGDYEFGGAKSTTRVNRSDGENALLQNAWNFQWEHNLLRSDAYYPWTIGDAQWEFYDGFEAYATTTSDWGVMDVFRLPKFSYYFYRSQMDPYPSIHGADNRPMAYIAGWWMPGDAFRKIIVYSNCDEVALYVNGKLIKKQKPDKGPDTPYGDFENGGHPFDGGNCRHLQHPPFTFDSIRFESGELKAVGYIRGKAVAVAERKTPGKPVTIRLSAATQGKPLIADGADVVFVYARIVDQNGTVALADNTTRVQFRIKGNARIAGPSLVKVRGGIAAILLQAKTLPGKIMIGAEAGHLKSKPFVLKTMKEK